MTDPQKALQFKTLGNQAFKNQKWEEAADYFTKAIECNPNDHVFYSNRSGSYCNMQNYQKALQDAEKCLQLSSGFVRGYQRKGTAQFYLGKVDDAILTYKEGLKLDPTNAALLNDLKAAQQKKEESQMGGNPFNFGQGQNSQFNPQYMNALMKLISNPQTKQYINDPSFMQQVQMCMQNPSAIPILMQQNPKLKKAFQVIQSDAPSNFNFEDLMKNAGQGAPPPQPQKKPEPKKEQPKKQQKMQPQDPAQNLKNQGNAAYKAKKFQQALNLYEEAIKINALEPLYYNNKAAVYIQLKQYDKALQQIARAESLFQQGKSKDFIKKAKILARKASVLVHQNQLQEAIKWYEKSLLEDNQPKIKDELTKIKQQKKQIDAKLYINPELAEKHCQEGNTYFKQGKFPAALAQYQEAIKRNPNVAKYYSNIGTAYIKLMEFARARDNFQKALKLDPNYIKAYAKKGDCHYLLKEYHKALQTYENGLKIDSQNQLCKQGVQKTQMAIYSNNSQQDQQERAKRAMQDPQIQQILQTPQIRNALAELQRDPKSIQNVLKDKNIAQKIDKLIQAGVLRVG